MGADHIGDVLCRTAGLAELKEGLGACRLHFIASRPAMELLETHPALDSVIVAEHPIESRSLMQRVQLLKSRPFDAVFCFDTGDYWKDQLAVALAGIPNCIGYSQKGFRGLATHVLPFRFPQPYSESFRYSVENLIGKPVSSDLRPTVHLTTQDYELADRAFADCSRSGRLCLAVGVTGKQPHSAALKDRMLETVAALQRHTPVTVIFLGAPSDWEEIEQKKKQWKIEGVNLCGKLRLRESIAFLKRMDAALVVDSGLRHMANAAEIPIVYFRNLYTFKGETGNYLPTEHDLAPDVECLSRKELALCPPLFEVEDGVRMLLSVLD